MYYKEIRVWVPNEEVLKVRFLKHERFFVYVFLNKPFIVTARVSDTRNFIGFGIDGNIYLLDRENNRVIYASSALAVFARQLKLYRDLDLTVPTEQADEYKPQDIIKDFAKQIQKLDNSAFSDENNFWSKVLSELDLIVDASKR